jgi:hypothetical protein
LGRSALGVAEDEVAGNKGDVGGEGGRQGAPQAWGKDDGMAISDWINNGLPVARNPWMMAPLLDLRIVLATLYRGFKHPNAY